ncbi:MAG: adenylate/guanylate cyclase domain-containing protein [Nanoarchaeota archaeon]|nr:adenylate/guanylate cyclase domain-containing protein [Nanoarchaeota archaeon]
MTENIEVRPNVPRSGTYSSADKTVLFTDLENSTRWHEENDESLIKEVLQEHDYIITTALSRDNRYSFYKTIGDSFMIIFEKAEDAINCAIEIQQEVRLYNNKEEVEEAKQIPGIKIGIDHGRIFIVENPKEGPRGYDYLGYPIDRCKRIQELADQGHILITFTALDTISSVPWNKYKIYPAKRSLKTYDVIKVGLILICEVIWEKDLEQQLINAGWLRELNQKEALKALREETEDASGEIIIYSVATKTENWPKEQLRNIITNIIKQISKTGLFNQQKKAKEILNKTSFHILEPEIIKLLNIYLQEEIDLQKFTEKSHLEDRELSYIIEGINLCKNTNFSIKKMIYLWLPDEENESVKERFKWLCDSIYYFVFFEGFEINFLPARIADATFGSIVLVDAVDRAKSALFGFYFEEDQKPNTIAIRKKYGSEFIAKDVVLSFHRFLFTLWVALKDKFSLKKGNLIYVKRIIQIGQLINAEEIAKDLVSKLRKELKDYDTIILEESSYLETNDIEMLQKRLPKGFCDDNYLKKLKNKISNTKINKKY